MLKRSISKVTPISLLAVLVILSMLSLIGCEKRPNRLYAPFIISPDGEELAFQVGPQWLNGKRPTVEPRPYVIKLGKDVAFRVIPLPKSLLPMAWRPGASPPELFGAIISDEHTTPDRIFAVAVSDSVSTILSQELASEISAWRMSWNPSGQILAARMSGSRRNEYLGISYDNGKNINVTDIVVSEAPVWINNEVLCVQNGNDILEVDVGDRNPRVTRTIASGEDVPAEDFYFYLVGSLDGKAVYVLGDEIYCDGRLLYHSNQRISQIIADGSYVAFKAGSYVWVLDGRGNLKSKKSIERDTTKLIAISSVHKFVYLVKNYQYIQRYSFVDGDEISTVYEVGR